MSMVFPTYTAALMNRLNNPNLTGFYQPQFGGQQRPQRSHQQRPPFGQFGRRPQTQSRMGMGQTNPMMTMMMASMNQMMNYIKNLESNVTGGTTTVGEATSTTTEPTETATTGGTVVDGTYSIDSLAEKHEVNMSGAAEQTLIVDGKHNMVVANTIEGEDGVDHYEVGSDNELTIAKFGPGDTLKLEGKAADYNWDISEGALTFQNKENGVEVTMGIDPALIGNDNQETLKNILSQVKTDDMTLWDRELLINYNPDAERATSEHKVGDKKSHKNGAAQDFGKNEEYHTFNITDVKGGFLKGAREDNTYVLQGNQNEFNIKGDHGANRFMIGATASDINIEKFGHDDSLQFVDPSAVQVGEGEHGEVIIYDASTSSTVTIQNATIDDVKERISAFDGEDALSKSVKKRAKNNKWAKIGVGAALTVGSMFVGAGGYGGAISKGLTNAGLSAGAAKIGGTVLSMGATAALGTQGISYIDAGALLGSKNPFLNSGNTITASTVEAPSTSSLDSNTTYDNAFYDPDAFIANGLNADDINGY